MPFLWWPSGNPWAHCLPLYKSTLCWSKTEIPEAGPNLPLLGIVEVPASLAQTRLQISKTSDIPVIQWNSSTPTSRMKIWTDASCVDSENFWFCKGACAAVDDLRHCFFKRMSDTSRCAVIRVSYGQSSKPFAVHMDLVNVVLILNRLCHKSNIWCWIFTFPFMDALWIYNHRMPLVIVWIPSHVLEHMPCHAISPALAKTAGSSREDIFGHPREAKRERGGAPIRSPTRQGFITQSTPKAELLPYNEWAQGQNGLRTSGVRSMDGWKKTEDGPWASPRLRLLRHKLSVRWHAQSSHVPTNHTGVTLGVWSTRGSVRLTLLIDLQAVSNSLCAKLVQQFQFSLI